MYIYDFCEITRDSSGFLRLARVYMCICSLNKKKTRDRLKNRRERAKREKVKPNETFSITASCAAAAEFLMDLTRVCVYARASVYIYLR